MDSTNLGVAPVPKTDPLARLRDLRTQVDAKLEELVRAIKAQDASTPEATMPNEEVRRLTRELHTVHAVYGRAGRKLQALAGIPDELFDEFEQSQMPQYDDRWWRSQIEATPPTEVLEETSARALEQLLGVVDRDWLSSEAEKPFRLDDSFLSSPLHLVAGVRLRPIDAGPDQGPQRLARMLLLARDNLAKRDDLDFFSSAMLVPELAALGDNLGPIATLGPEAARAMEGLSTAEDSKVASTIYELLVGAACVRKKGRNLTMLTPDPVRKSPDFRVHDLGVPAVIECKRRLGLTSYELAEARLVEQLYAAVRPSLRDAGVHGSIHATFQSPVSTVDAATFATAVLRIASRHDDGEAVAMPWGELAFLRLPYVDQVPDTRLYSPDYLEDVFGWAPLQDEWDGILCEVEAPTRIRVDRFRDPLCLKWRSLSPEAIRRKTRHITSLWADAAKQVPAGETGFIYVAYPEGNRPTLADARTTDIMASTAEWWHRWNIRVPVTVITRLYPRAIRMGMPDLVESSLPGAAEGQEFWLTMVPARVFTGYGTD
jgi:hypothetical protein